MRFSLLPFLAAGLLFAADVQCAILKVPSLAYPTISSALAAAAPGDTIFVKPGVYTENLVWPNVDGIHLVSVKGPAVTRIDGGGAGRVITMEVPLSRATWLVGFSISGGYIGSGSARHGAGIKIYTNTGGACSPTIRGCVIEKNKLDGSYWDYGGGIYISGPTGTPSSPLIINNVIQYNSLATGSLSGGWNYGGGIYIGLGGKPDIIGNEIYKNQCLGGNYGFGGGIYVGSALNSLITGNIIAANNCQSNSYNMGGGISMSTGTTATIVGNTITSNQISGGSFRHGSGVYLFRTGPTVFANNIVTDNNDRGIYVSTLTGPPPVLDYNDVWNNANGNYYGISAGPNSISVDPKFQTSWPFHLGNKSPCVDAGSFAMTPADACIDVDGDPRRLRGKPATSSPGPVVEVDIGADEFTRYSLVAGGQPQLGSMYQLTTQGPAGQIYGLLLDGAVGNQYVAPFGQLLLGPGAAFVTIGTTPLAYSFYLPPIPALAGLTLYFQSVVALPGGEGFLTNRVDATLR